MLSLQQLIYQQLPQDVKKKIVTNPELYPEYNEVISNLNREVLQSFKSKFKLSAKNIRFFKIMLEVCYHITLFPPRTMFPLPDDQPVFRAWDDFKIKNNYSIYDEYQNHVNRWPKFMFLLKETYKHAYNQYWHLAAFGAGQPLGFFEYQLPQFDYVTMNFFTYIVELYRYIDENITLKKLRKEADRYIYN